MNQTARPDDGALPPYLDGFVDAREMAISYLRGRATGLRSRDNADEAVVVDRVRDELAALLVLDDHELDASDGPRRSQPVQHARTDDSAEN